MSATKRSSKDFQLYLRALLCNEGPKVKYQNPDGWRGNLFYR